MQRRRSNVSRMFKFQLAALFVVTAILLVIIAWSGYEAITTMQEVRNLPVALRQMQGDFLIIGHDLSRSIEDLNRLLLKIVAKNDRTAVEMFQRKSEELEAKLQEQQSNS